jgi:RNA polymerase sigma factor (sigma-70 family)
VVSEVGVAERTDAELVVAGQRGDHEAVAELLHRHLRLARHVIDRALDGHPDTGELVQGTVVSAVEKLPDLRDPTRFRPWLITIAIHQVKGWRRAAAPPSPNAEAPSRAGREEEHRMFREATRWVTEDDQTLLTLWWQELNGELTRGELADTLLISRPHAAVRVKRLRSHLARVHTVLTAYAARPRCPGLSIAAKGWDLYPEEPVLARMARHVPKCYACRAAGRGLLPPDAHLTGLGTLDSPALLEKPLAPSGGPGAAHSAAEVLPRHAATDVLPRHAETPEGGRTTLPRQRRRGLHRGE